MRAPRFWWQADGAASRILAPAGALVGAVAARRLARAPDATLQIPVICIGNPTVGGSGKTPVALAAAAVLREAGASPVFLTRGYGGTMRGPVVVDAHTASEVGDEALELAASAPVVVSRERGAGGRLAATLGDVVVMDDGFQNPGLAKTWSALVVDAAAGLGNGRTTPAGPMRAPLTAQLPFADAVILVETGEREAALPPFGAVPVHRATLTAAAPRPLAGEAVIAFAGIGRPEKFFAAVRGLGADVREARPFPDHHFYTDADAAALLSTGLPLVTTRKDRMRLAGTTGPRLALYEATTEIGVTCALSPTLAADIAAAYRG